jgi:hypothetical protein
MRWTLKNDGEVMVVVLRVRRRMTALETLRTMSMIGDHMEGEYLPRRPQAP